jgi:alginate O-acetyltransferase complex protein AlgJ
MVGLWVGVTLVFGGATAKDSGEPATPKPPQWPQKAGAVFALRNASVSAPLIAFDAKGQELLAFECAPRGRALFGRFYELVCDGGSFIARDAGPWIGQKVGKSNAVTVEVTLTPAETMPTIPGVVLAYADDKGEDFALLHDKGGLALRWGGKQSIELFKPDAGKTVHVLLAIDQEKWVVYRDGQSVCFGRLPAAVPAWSIRQLVLGAAWSGAHPWRGRLEGIAFFPWALTADEAAKEAAASIVLRAGRKPATTVRFQGTLIRQAKTANLKAIQPYTRSMTIAEYKVEKVLAGEWKQQKIKVLHWMIMDGKRLPLADRKPGALVELQVDSLGDHPQLESCRRDDELDDEISDDLFYCESEPSKDTESDAAGFREACAKKASMGDSLAIAGDDGWFFLRSELRHIGTGQFWGEAAKKVSQASSPDKADPLPAILDFHEQLKAKGIELIMMPVPCKALVYPEKINKVASQRIDTAHQQFFKVLEEKGVKVVDLGAVFLEEKSNPRIPLLYCKSDSHWSPYACQVAAKQIKKQFKAPAWLDGKPERFTTKQEPRTITGDLADGKGSEVLPTLVVQSRGASLEDKASPILLLGDSHTLVFHAGAELHGTGAGLADHLAAELGLAVDVIGVRGSGATSARVNLLRRIKADPRYLAGKKVVIWCFAAREFTESTGWSVLKLDR